MALGRITMKKWPILLVVLCLALLGQDQDREAKYHLVPYDSIRDHSLFRIVHERPEKRGPVDIARNPLIQTTIAASPRDREWAKPVDLVTVGHIRGAARALPMWVAIVR